MLNQQTLDKMIQLGLKGMVTSYENQIQQPNFRKLSFEERLNILIEAEYSTRDTRKIERLLKSAKLRYSNACLEEVIYKNQRNFDQSQFMELGDCHWLINKQAVLITGATGVGKSWLACALGNQACRKHLNTIYISSTALIEQIQLALEQNTMNKLRRSLVNAKLLIIDDFGIGQIPSHIGSSILEIIDQQSMNGGLMITSQLPVEHWYDLFNNPTIADAILDRIVHRAYRIELKGESMRKRNIKTK
ncbi:IS21-like element helper ATPase IstB [Wohlfahrtiimonas populi]|uniref:IS21-like element helper ATPase IstB n=1 Tax=Wohlfahrtiimonas populi TaxID=1940240 RepID=UPI00098D5F73|nr:IS21-like element helper ATPase IstB [Wohlfahrtiimonas populi]